VMVIKSGTYAAEGAKHSVRPADMAGKSAGMILRRMHPEVKDCTLSALAAHT
jgi:hypothetical protein